MSERSKRRKHNKFDVNPNIFCFRNKFYFHRVQDIEFLDLNVMYGFGKLNLENPTVFNSENYFKYYILKLVHLLSF